MAGHAASQHAGIRAWPWLLVALLACAIALSWLAHLHARLPADPWLTRRVQDLPGALEGPAKAIRFVTSTETVLGLGALLVLATLLARRWQLAAYCGCTLVLLPALQSGLKQLVDRPRPAPALVDVRDTFTSSSFPSGHVMSGTVLFALITVAAWQSPMPGYARQSLAWGCGALAALNGLANVYMGVHWPSDVVGGYLWAAVLLAGAWAMVRAAQRPA